MRSGSCGRDEHAWQASSGGHRARKEILPWSTATATSTLSTPTGASPSPCSPRPLMRAPPRGHPMANSSSIPPTAVDRRNSTSFQPRAANRSCCPPVTSRVQSPESAVINILICLFLLLILPLLFSLMRREHDQLLLFIFLTSSPVIYLTGPV